MTDASPQSDDSIDVRLLARQDLPHEAFPGGRNEGFRAYFSPAVHAALWKHAAADTSVEICGVLVGSWHRDEVGPFVKVTESIRGEGAETRFAEVTFTHKTWAKINAEMDTKYTNLSIVGWYHTHPDFGIFLSDRDRFIHEHFFSGPGQVAHVIDPIRQIEGVFVWHDAKPVLTPHFWVGDRIMVGTSAGADGAIGLTGDARSPRSSAQRMSSSASDEPAQRQGSGSNPQAGRLLPPLARMIIYGGVFLLGYFLANILSAWERERFVADVLTSNGLVAVLRLGLADELDRLSGDLVAVNRPLESVRSTGDKPDEALVQARDRLVNAARRVSAIKRQYGNTPAEDDLLRRFLRDKLTGPAQATSQPAGAAADTKPKGDAAPSASPGDGKARDSPGKNTPSQP
jgi:proteasome lid subunit RPN8/RPN11